jgi:hypothetical protein
MMDSMMQGRQANMIDQGGMMGMMSQISQMMEGCSEMMQGMGGGQRPNEQWRDRSPQQPDRQPR